MTVRQVLVSRQIFKRKSRTRRPRLSVAPDERVYAIGDVHGRADLLLGLLERIQADAWAIKDHRRTRLVFLGDYIDRGDDTARVLKILSGLKESETDGIVCLMGNHEAALLSFLSDPIGNPDWLRFGAMQTLASFGVEVLSADPDPVQRVRIRDALAYALRPYMAFLRGLDPMVRSGDVVFAHAGWRPENPNTAGSTQDMLWGYSEFLQAQPVPGVRVVHGHYDSARPVSAPGRICVDTGAYYSGLLTAVRLDDGEVFLSVNGADMG